MEATASNGHGANPALTLDDVSEHWRIVFDTAQDALRAAERCGTSLGFASRELHERVAGLQQERQATALLLEALAREEHAAIRHHLAAPRATRRMLGLPDEVLGCVFELDGVLTASASIHAAAWAETFDPFLARRSERTGERFAPFRPFDPGSDYYRHIHARPRIEGIHAFLASRGIRLPEGHFSDPPGTETVFGLANRKNEALLRRLDREGVTAFAGSRRYLEAVREAGLRCAVVSASANTAVILERAGLADLVETRIDGNTIRAERLRSKPAPDTMIAAARLLGVQPARAVAFETTVAGLDAAHAAGYGLVIGVDREGRAETLRAHGADVVVPDFAELLDPAIPF
jgi:HAD superfamily hydrolase (TIGR01509 family)